MIGAVQGQRHILKLALLLFLFALVRLAYGQQRIAIRFVDYQSGKPIKNFYLAFEAFSGKWSAIVTKDTSIVSEKYSKECYGKVTVRLPRRESEDATVVFFASTKVDRDGTLSVHLPETLPEHIRVSAPLELWSSIPDFSPADVLETGEVVPFDHGHVDATTRFSRKPGEIVILTKRRTVWDRMRQEVP